MGGGRELWAMVNERHLPDVWIVIATTQINNRKLGISRNYIDWQYNLNQVIGNFGYRRFGPYWKSQFV